GAFIQLGGLLDIKNISTSAFTVHGHKQTFEYFSPVTHGWVPVASFARDNSGATIPSAPLLDLTFSPSSFSSPDGEGVTYPQDRHLFGTVIDPNATGHWGYAVSVTLPAASAAQVFDPAQAAGYRLTFHVDTSEVAGVPPEIVAAASASDVLAGFDG